MGAERNAKQEIRREVEWENKIRECQESGLGVQEWCRQNNINATTYYYHLRKTHENKIEQKPIPIYGGSSASNDPIIEIQIGEAIVKIPEGMSERTIKSVVRALK